MDLLHSIDITSLLKACSSLLTHSSSPGVRIVSDFGPGDQDSDRIPGMQIVGPKLPWVLEIVLPAEYSVRFLLNTVNGGAGMSSFVSQTRVTSNCTSNFY